jgi:hypothetical protein
METVRAISNMARAEAEGMDGARTPGGLALKRQVDGMHAVATRAITMVNANGLNPDRDQATQIRLAAAVDRQMTGRTSERHTTGAATRAVMNDFYLQEAAARILEQQGARDPLAHLASKESTSRADGHSLEILSRNGVEAGKVLRTASRHDIGAIASGRFDKVQSEHTRFAVSTVLGQSDEQMRTPTARVPEVATPDAPRRPFPAMGLSAAQSGIPRTASFGRKMVGAER